MQAVDDVSNSSSVLAINHGSIYSSVAINNNHVPKIGDAPPTNLEPSIISVKCFAHQQLSHQVKDVRGQNAPLQWRI